MATLIPKPFERTLTFDVAGADDCASCGSPVTGVELTGMFTAAEDTSEPKPTGFVRLNVSMRDVTKFRVLPCGHERAMKP